MSQSASEALLWCPPELFQLVVDVVWIQSEIAGKGLGLLTQCRIGLEPAALCRRSESHSLSGRSSVDR